MLNRLRNRRLSQKRGQAVIEMALALPFLIWLFYYTINAFYTIHTAHVGQNYAAMNMYERLNNRAQFSVDDVAQSLTSTDFIAVQYTEVNGQVPQRKILLGPTRIQTIIGICREPGCN